MHESDQQDRDPDLPRVNKEMFFSCLFAAEYVAAYGARRGAVVAKHCVCSSYYLTPAIELQ